MTLYIIVPPMRLHAYAPLLRLWLSGLILALTQRKAPPRERTLMLVDEAANIGRMDALLTAATLLRSWGFTLWCFLENAAQLSIYGAQANTLVDNAAVIQIFGVKNHRMATDLANLIGGIAPDELLKMQARQQILLIDGKLHRAQQIRYYDDSKPAYPMIPPSTLPTLPHGWRRLRRTRMKSSGLPAPQQRPPILSCTGTARRLTRQRLARTPSASLPRHRSGLALAEIRLRRFCLESRSFQRFGADVVHGFARRRAFRYSFAVACHATDHSSQMSEDQAANQAPAPRLNSWKIILLRSAGFGGGFAVVLVLLLGAIYWWSERPKPWSENAVTAKPSELYTRQVDEEVRVEFHYAFTNHTNTEYTLPSPESGTLMRHVPNASSVEKLDGAAWDTTIRIPPRQSVGIVFSVPYRLGEFSTSNEELDTADKLTEFLGRRLRDINGMTFFDYAAKYRIEMPDIREALPKGDTKKAAPEEPKKPAKAVIPPDKGDAFDRVAACGEAERLLDRCRRANISSSTSSPWVKYGGWPNKLKALPTPPAGYALDPSTDVCVTAAEWHNYCKAKVK